ncbi:MAG: GTP-binding protein [Micromonosporaceae bacterium]
MSTLNLGILAHVDAGKTSLTERLLHAAGVIDEIGSVDDGNTQTDSLALERQRGITIKSAVVSFVVDGVTVNLIDTPGHPDFIAEVERVLSVLDGAALVVSAVEGVQAQTRVLMRTLRRLRIPTLIFVNKIDRRGAQDETLLRAMAEKLVPAVVAMGTVDGLGTHGARFVPHTSPNGASPHTSPNGARFAPGIGHHTDQLLELLAEHDDALLARYLDDAAVPYQHLEKHLAEQTGSALIHPVFYGSAITGAGVDALLGGITELLPTSGGDAGGPVSGAVFKIERGPAGEKIAYTRMFSGTVSVRDRVRIGDGEGKVTGIRVFADGSDAPQRSVAAGQIGKLWGLGDARVGDSIGLPTEHRRHFAPPTLETVIAARRPEDKGALAVALAQLTEQDPLINLRQDDVRQETYLSLYGEVQKEVIEATLAEDFGIGVTFRETTTICIERPVGSGAAVEFISKEPNPFLATVGLRVDPAPAGAGVRFRLEVELGSMPYSFIRAVEETVVETLRQGIHGWEVTDCTVTMTHSGYYARQSHAHGTFDKSMSSTAGDFRNLTPLVLMSALLKAGTRVYEPLHHFHLELPGDSLGTVLPALARLRAVPGTPSPRGRAYTLEGEIPAAGVHSLRQRLPGLTRGEGVLETAFDGHRPVQGTVPSRPRTDHNPLRRDEYLLHVVRRV